MVVDTSLVYVGLNMFHLGAAHCMSGGICIQRRRKRLFYGSLRGRTGIDYSLDGRDCFRIGMVCSAGFHAHLWFIYVICKHDATFSREKAKYNAHFSKGMRQIKRKSGRHFPAKNPANPHKYWIF